MQREGLAELIREIGFSCIRCGECCTGTDNLVMLYPSEIREISGATGRNAGDFTEPYPEKVRMPGGGSIMFGRCLKRTARGCIFLDGSCCTAYASRPWICRTYPFMLSGEELAISPCRGIGQEISYDEAMEIAGFVIARRAAEQEEEDRIRALLSSIHLPRGAEIVIDETGVRVL